jgi:hypothetical protein
MKRIALCAAAAASLLACGKSSATSHNNAGTGTATLLVTADVSASMTSGGPVTSFAVDVHDGVGNRVSGATVTMNNADLGPVTLVEATSGSGHYVNSKASFPGGDFQLSVVRSSDNVQNVLVGGPGSHTINAPTRSAVVPANQPLVLSWTTPSTAKAVSISTKDFDGQGPDTGTYTIPAASNPARNNQRLDISRYNEVDMAGGLSGSRLRVTFTSTVDPYTVAPQ